MYNKSAVKCYEKGRVLSQNGKLSEAGRAYKKAIKINPDFVEAHNNLGSLLLDRGQLIEALHAYRKALKLRPCDPMLLNNLGNALQLQGENEKAISWFEKAIIQDPNFAYAHSDLGNALRDLGRIGEAIDSYKQAIYINSGLADTYNNLGCILTELDELDEAVTNFKKAIEIDPKHTDAYNGLGNALSEQGEIDKAIAAYHKVIEIDPKHTDAYNGLGNALSEQGEIDKAIVLYRKAIEIYPEYAAAYRAISMIKKFSENDPDIHSMESLYATESISDEQKMHLAFGLGKAYEDLGAYEKSMEFTIEANHLMHTSIDFSITEALDFFCNLKETFSLGFFTDHKGVGNPDRTPIFIVGMPRSGTSLVEQILASHPDVYGAGELNDLLDLTKKICAADSPSRFPQCIIDLDSGTFEEIGKKYIAGIRIRSKDTKYITDKVPHNFLHIGFIKAILPNAKIIHLTRDPMDNCLSIFKNYFSNGHHYSYDMTELGQYYNLYLDLMEYWRSTLPGFIHDLSYERLIANQEDQTRKLLDYCDLAWDDCCLDFHRTRRQVKTASKAQVRRPIYKDSVMLWKKYEKQLKPLVAEIYG